MTIQEAIGNVDRLTPNHYPPELKVKWLSKLDGQIFSEVFQTHENGPIESFEGYDKAGQDTELLVTYPYDENIYTYFLQAQIAKENGEIPKYNQAITLYNNAFQSFQNWYNRTHMPKADGKHFRF